MRATYFTATTRIRHYAGEMIMELPLAGGCLCGAIRYQISAEPSSADYCHCSMCRRAAGAPVVARLTVPNASFGWTAGQPAVYRSSQKAERFFCPTCGTQLALRDEPDYLDVTLASLDAPEAVRPSYHIWTASRIGWFEISDDLPRYPESARAEA
jgi:hypothetical protein